MEISQSTYASLVLCLGIVVRWCISLNSYSGAGKPPMFGDYEAQRHWMELTLHLPPSQWYVNGTDNDLLYWGLDYPPLTAYHSYILGSIAQYINSSWTDLHTSRGTEGLQHKLFMRYSVLAADMLVYIPAVMLYCLQLNHLPKERRWLTCLTILFYPGLNLIDYGHFQYNSVSLGLTVWAVIGLSSGWDIAGAAAFVLALNYKQMELYHAMPFFCYLLGSCFTSAGWKSLFKLVSLGVVVILSFAICWLPFLQDPSAALQVLSRLFPFNRGLYEDKVANVWCSLSVLIKLKEILSQKQLVSLCLGSTVLGLLPSSIHLLIRPSVGRFKVALVNASLVFFLFSFQVHEKSILLAALPVCLLLPWQPVMCSWFLLVTSFSMLPLLVKDGLLGAYIGSTVIFIACSYMAFARDDNEELTTGQTQSPTPANNVLKYVFALSQLGSWGLLAASQTMQPPARLPDLFPVLISAYSAAHFLAFLAYFHWLQYNWVDDVTKPVSTKIAPRSSVKLDDSGDAQTTEKPSKYTFSVTPKTRAGKKKAEKNEYRRVTNNTVFYDN